MKVYRLRHGDFDIGPYNAWIELVARRYGYCAECDDGLHEPCAEHDGDTEVVALAKVAEKLMEAHNEDSTNHPVPEPARLRMRIRYGNKVVFLCGMDSLDGLDKWFAGFWDELVELGFCLATYDIPKAAVEIDYGQVLFRERDIQHVCLDK